MAIPWVPARGGFQRPFGAAVFIRDFLMGRGEDYGVAAIDSQRGATQSDIRAVYKMALHWAWAEERVNDENDERAKREVPIYTQEEYEARRQHWLGCIPWGRCRMRYHSFLDYFGLMKRLGWVELTGRVEESLAQKRMALAGFVSPPPAALSEQALEAIQSLPDESKKPESLAKLETALHKLAPEQREALDGLSELEQAISDYKGISKKGLTLEEYQDSKGDAWGDIEDAVANLSAKEGEEQPEVTSPVSTPAAPRETGQPRVYYRLSAAGVAAGEKQVKNPLMALYPQFDPAYFAQKRKQHHYVRCV